MLAQNAQRSLEVAAAQTLARIRTDQTKVDSRLRPLLEHIEKHLFDPGLDVNQLKRRCGVRDNSIPIQFHAKLGLPPHAYIEDCRLSTACSLLRDTDLKIWQIASLLGYSSIQVFSRAFSRWAKTRPTAYRRTARRNISADPVNEIAAARASKDRTSLAHGRAISVPAAALQAASRPDNDLQRALDGELDAGQAARLIRRLLNLYPATSLLLDRPAAAAESSRRSGNASVPMFRARMRPQRTNGSGHHVGDHHGNGHKPIVAEDAIAAALQPPGPDYRRLLTLEEIETARAEALWEQIKHLPQDEMRMAIRESGEWETGALFEAVRMGGIVLGRSDRQRGIEIAETLLEFSREPLALDESSKVRALASAWTWIGNARRLAFDLPGAHEALSTAQRLAKDAQVGADVSGSVLRIVADVMMYERRYEDAAATATNAIRLFEQANLDVRVAETLNQRAVYYRELEQFTSSLDDVDRALSILESGEESYARFVALSTKAFTYCRMGETASALDLLRKARTSRLAATDPEYVLKLRWLEAELASENGDVSRAEGLYSSLVEEFSEKSRPTDAAFAGIELAWVYWSSGQCEKTVALLHELVPALQRMNMAPDALGALSLLSKAAQASTLTKALVEKARERIQGRRD